MKINQILYSSKIDKNNKNKYNKEFQDKIDNTTKYSGLFTFLSFKKIPSWLKPLIYIILILFGIDYVYDYFDIDRSQILGSNLIYLKYFLSFGVFTTTLLIFYYILKIWLFIMFSKNKIDMPIHLPRFILNWLKTIQELSTINDKGAIISFYLLLLITNIFVLLLVIFALYLL